jgi:energy-coupling factor transporter ATP-binding protein EcfA2
VTVLQEILEWSTERSAWQRDALRRLVTNGDLSGDDIRALAEICKSNHGLAEPQEVLPLATEHIPEKGAGVAPVSLASIFHHRGVNALAENQTLRFGNGLTVVYGDNGAGKTGYIRILKSACRTRGQEVILGNVTSGSAPLAPVVSIKYQVGTEPDQREWTGAGQDDFISRVSVFDTQSASVYLTEKTDVAFRPFGLDLFDKLVKACKSVRERLESEQRRLSTTTIPTVQAQVPPDSAVGRLLAGLSSLTKLEAVQTLARLSSEEDARLVVLEKSLQDLQANDPEKLARQLTLRLDRVKGLTRHINGLETALSDQSIAAVLNVRTEGRRKSEEAKRLRDATFQAGLLPGTGTEQWSALWEAARSFSKSHAYTEQEFPFTGNGAHCILCQQELDEASANRLQQFEAFVASTTERELRLLRVTFNSQRDAFVNLKTKPEAIEDTLKEIRIENEAAADCIEKAIAANEARRASVVAALAAKKDLPPDTQTLVQVAGEAQSVAAQIEARLKALRKKATDAERAKMTSEVKELRARKVLAQHEKSVLDDIERRKKIAAYGLCLDDTKTAAITQKSTAVTKTTVSEKLKRSFQKELATLSFRQVEVELKELGGTDGVFYHKLVLTRAPGVDLPKVVSEGEQRCLSIAAFFADLSTADNPSGIVFDDPVSSLDYQWRQGVARRLVDESKTRQVIVFTHDVVFLLQLKQFSEELKVEPLDQHVRSTTNGAGVCANELPWVALKVAKRFGVLKNLLVEADKLSRDGHQDAYEREATYIYGLLREAWERALEEVLLGGVVERYRPGVQTQQIAKIADITAEDCQAVATAMTKCSTWLPGHDKAPAARAPVPAPAELKADIEALEAWVKAINKRREKKI